MSTLVVQFRKIMLVKAFQGNQRGNTQHGIAKDIYHHMGYEPGTLKCGHQGFIVGFRMRQVDDQEDIGHHDGISQEPLVFPAEVYQQSDGRQEKSIP